VLSGNRCAPLVGLQRRVRRFIGTHRSRTKPHSCSLGRRDSIASADRLWIRRWCVGLGGPTRRCPSQRIVVADVLLGIWLHQIPVRNYLWAVTTGPSTGA